MKSSPLLRLLQETPGIESVEMVLTDLNGIYRGKWVPVDNNAKKVIERRFKIPLTAISPDIWGRDIPALCEKTGDGDGKPRIPATRVNGGCQIGGQAFTEIKKVEQQEFSASVTPLEYDTCLVLA
jgi:glutamine synthetase